MVASDVSCRGCGKPTIQPAWRALFRGGLAEVSWSLLVYLSFCSFFNILLLFLSLWSAGSTSFATRWSRHDLEIIIPLRYHDLIIL